MTSPLFSNALTTTNGFFVYGNNFPLDDFNPLANQNIQPLSILSLQASLPHFPEDWMSHLESYRVNQGAPDTDQTRSRMRRLAYMYIIRPNARDSAGAAMPNFTFHRNEAVSFLEGGRISYTSLQRATEAGRMDAVRSLLRGLRVNINAPNEQGVILLHRAVQDMCIDIVRVLLQFPEVNVNIQDTFGHTALYLAVYRRDINTVRALLDAPGINVNIQDAFGHTALHLAVYRRDINTVRALLDAPGINVTIQDELGNTALHLALQLGYTEIVRLLFQVRNQWGSTAFQQAAEAGRIDVLSALLDSLGVDVNIQDAFGHTALHLAAEEGHFDVVRFLLGVPGVNVTIQDELGNTALHLAAEEGHFDVVKILRNRLM